MTEDTFNPEATDGDGDGIIQEGTKFERPIEDLLVNPVEEPAVAEEPAEMVIEEEPVVVKAPEPEEEAPAIVPVADGVIGTGKVKKKAEPKPKAPAAEKSDTVALFSSRNIAWQGVGKLVKGYNLVSADAAEKWLTLDAVRSANPEEIKTNLG